MEELASTLSDAGLDPMEEQTVNEAVSWLNARVQSSGLALAIEVHAYVIDRFFRGEYAAFASKNPLKSKSFNALCRREDLELSRTTLSLMVRTGEQLKTMPAPIAQALSMRHHRALLQMDDVGERNALAAIAAEQGWTAATLDEVIRSQRPPGPPGRPALPVVLKEARALRRALGAPDGDDGDEAAAQALTASVRGMDVAQQEELRDALLAVEARVKALLKAVGRRREIQ
ncbi:MAG: hypothetical protein KC635_21670 [Myxococcales bacterium]|nr:hypothetical protein [Myxococcales bacterium]MCB9736978.1 hypothetical protein [Deltaproteobacteria bacterium]